MIVSPRILITICLLLVICFAAMTNGAGAPDTNWQSLDKGDNTPGNRQQGNNKSGRCIPIDCGLLCTERGFSGSRCLGDRCICL